MITVYLAVQPNHLQSVFEDWKDHGFCDAEKSVGSRHMQVEGNLLKLSSSDMSGVNFLHSRTFRHTYFNILRRHLRNNYVRRFTIVSNEIPDIESEPDIMWFTLKHLSCYTPAADVFGDLFRESCVQVSPRNLENDEKYGHLKYNGMRIPLIPNVLPNLCKHWNKKL